MIIIYIIYVWLLRVYYRAASTVYSLPMEVIYREVSRMYLNQQFIAVCFAVYQVIER